MTWKRYNLGKVSFYQYMIHSSGKFLAPFAAFHNCPSYTDSYV